MWEMGFISTLSPTVHQVRKWREHQGMALPNYQRGCRRKPLPPITHRLFTYCSHTLSLFTISFWQVGLWQHVVSSLTSLANELMPQWAQVHFWRDPTGVSEQVNAGGRRGPVGCDICCRETRPRWDPGSYSKVKHLEKYKYEDQILLASNRWKFRIAPQQIIDCLFFHIMHYHKA